MTNRRTERGLGRGLSALMNDLGAADGDAPLELKSDPSGVGTKALAKASSQETSLPADPSGPHVIAISRLQRNPDQPRQHFERSKMDDLIASIQQRGVLQPILVRELTDAQSKGLDQYQIVAGERRWQAALKAGLTQVPIIVRALSDRDVLEIGVIENVQRADLNAMEEARAYQRLSQDFGRTQAEIATTIGKSRAHIANTMRLNNLSERAQDLVSEGRLKAGHARCVLAANDPDALAETIVKKRLSVREAEAWVKAETGRTTSPASRSKQKSPNLLSLEQRIQDRTGLAADIRHSGRGGEIRLKYRDLKQMEDLLKRLDAHTR